MDFEGFDHRRGKMVMATASFEPAAFSCPAPGISAICRGLWSIGCPTGLTYWIDLGTDGKIRGACYGPIQ
jgi:hypothetical protein